MIDHHQECALLSSLRHNAILEKALSGRLVEHNTHASSFGQAMMATHLNGCDIVDEVLTIYEQNR